MIQRVGLAQALVNDPEVVFLDEPMSGLDPLGRRDVRALILRLRDEGRTVFFSSHILSDAETLCSRIAIVASGRLMAGGHAGGSPGAQLKGWEIVLDGLPSRRRAMQPAATRAPAATRDADRRATATRSSSARSTIRCSARRAARRAAGASSRSTRARDARGLVRAAGR